MDTWSAAGLGGVVVTVIGGVTAAIIKLTDNRHKHRRAERLDTLKDYKDLLLRLSRDNDEMKKELVQIRERLSTVEQEQRDCERHRSRAHDHIQQLETVLIEAGIKFRPFHPDAE